MAVEKPWPKCCTLEAFNNLYWQQESKMENFVLIPPTLNLSCFLMHRYVFFTLYVLRMLSCDCECLISVWHTTDETEQSRAESGQMSKWPNSVPAGKKTQNLRMCRLSGWLICLACLFRWFIVTNGWNNLCVWCLQHFFKRFRSENPLCSQLSV